MILTVSFNSAVDRTYILDNFQIGRLHRPSEYGVFAGGKGINVARVYRELGGEAVVTGFIGGRNGDIIQEYLRAESIISDFVRTEGESRTCIAIIDPHQRTQTEINEPGPVISEEEIDRLILKFESLVGGMEFAVLSGNLPQGVNGSLLGELIKVARRYGVRCVLDSSGEALAAGLAARPYIAKPNIHELSAIVGKEIATIEEAAHAAMEFIRSGVTYVIVTLGRDGAIVVSSEGVWSAVPPEIDFRSAVGSGDSFIAAFIHSLSSGQGVEEALRMGTAAGAANATCIGAGFCKKEQIMSMASGIAVSSLDLI